MIEYQYTNYGGGGGGGGGGNGGGGGGGGQFGNIPNFSVPPPNFQNAAPADNWSSGQSGGKQIVLVYKCHRKPSSQVIGRTGYHIKLNVNWSASSTIAGVSVKLFVY